MSLAGALRQHGWRYSRVPWSIANRRAVSHCLRFERNRCGLGAPDPRGQEMAAGNARGNNRMLYLIVGALCIVVAGGGYFLLGGTLPGQKAQTTEIKIELPKVQTK